MGIGQTVRFGHVDVGAIQSSRDPAQSGLVYWPIRLRSIPQPQDAIFRHSLEDYIQGGLAV